MGGGVEGGGAGDVVFSFFLSFFPMKLRLTFDFPKHFSILCFVSYLRVWLHLCLYTYNLYCEKQTLDIILHISTFAFTKW